MARMIDADALHAEISAWPESIMYKDWVQSAIANAPTLTQPNEPLTLEQLREMDGEPVWVNDEKTYAILQVWDDDNIDAIFSKPRGYIHAKAAIGMKIYRRPPEGEEEI